MLSTNTRLNLKICIIWMKVSLQSMISKPLNVLLMLQFVKHFEQSLDVKNGSHRSSAFVPTKIRFHPWSYSRARIYHVNGYLLLFITTEGLAVIQRAEQVMYMGCNGFVLYLKRKRAKKQMENRVFWSAMDTTVISRSHGLLIAWGIILFSWFCHRIHLT